MMLQLNSNLSNLSCPNSWVLGHALVLFIKHQSQPTHYQTLVSKLVVFYELVVFYDPAFTASPTAL